MDCQFTLVVSAMMLGFILMGTVSTQNDGRPKLLSTTSWQSEETLIDVHYSRVMVDFEFDQPLYVNEPLLCPYAEEPCPPPPSCTPCDWTGPVLSGCDNPNCCGMAQFPALAPPFSSFWWCNRDYFPFTTITEGISGPFFIYEPLFASYYRFFLDESVLCREVRLTVRSEYGSVNVMISNINPFPSFEDGGAQWAISTSKRGFGQSYITLCPSDPTMQPGTYSVTVEGVTASLFYLELTFSELNDRPLALPPSRVNCSNIMMTDLGYLAESFPGENTCLEDGITSSIAITKSNVGKFVQLLLPVPAGCHTVTLTAVGTAGQVQPDIFCLPVDNSRYPTPENSLVSRQRDGSDSLLFVGCYEEEVTYISCSLISEKVGQVALIWSTQAKPLQTRIEDTQPGGMPMTQGLGAVQAVKLGPGETHDACNDYYFNCLSWLVYPLSEPLPYWPPPADTPKMRWYWFELPVPTAIENGLTAVQSNKLSLVVALQAGKSKSFFDLDDYLAHAKIVSVSITGESGLPIQFYTSQSAVTESSLFPFLPVLPAENTNFVTSHNCHATTFQNIVEEIDRVILRMVEESTAFTNTVPFQLSIINYRGMRPALGCAAAAIGLMKSQLETVNEENVVDCRWDKTTESDLWESDACCNPELASVQCCIPATFTTEKLVYLGVNTSQVEEQCHTPVCTETFVQDLAYSINYIDSSLLGCSFGSVNQVGEIGSTITQAKRDVFIPCKELVGLGENYQGVSCISDSDCAQIPPYHCDRAHKVCALLSPREVDDAYLRCYIDRMDSVTESVLRDTVPGLTNYSRSDDEFFEIIRQISVSTQCSSTKFALENQYLIGFVYDAPSLSCKADVLGMTLPQDTAQVLSECGAQRCLDTTCTFVSKECYEKCQPKFTWDISTLYTCPSTYTCNVDMPAEQCNGDFVCAYCPPSAFATQCVHLPDIDTPEKCSTATVCELANGEFVVGLSEDECLQTQGSCSADCEGEMCMSLTQLPGMCAWSLATSQSDCDDFAVLTGEATLWYMEFSGESLCVFPNIEQEEECNEISPSGGVSWSSCSDYSPSGLVPCDQTSSARQAYMQCYVETRVPCATQQQCEAAAYCTDREYTRQKRDSAGVYVYADGACFTSGVTKEESRPVECGSFDSIRPVIGCVDLNLTEEQCNSGKSEDGYLISRKWLTTANTRNECVQNAPGRYGCHLPWEPTQHLVWYNTSDCECAFGTSEYAWEWIEGTWSGGIVRTPSWTQARFEPDYGYASTLLYVNLDYYVIASYDIAFSDRVKSQSICANTAVLTPLSSIVCDCFDDTDELVPPVNPENNVTLVSCFETVKEKLVGSYLVCKGLNVTLRGPGSRFDLYESSLQIPENSTEICVSILLAVVERNWVTANTAKTSVSFQFQEKEDITFVRNSASQSVGRVIGNGVSVSITNAGVVGYVQLCLALEMKREAGKYPQLDFGFSDDDLDVVTPLQLQNISADVIQNVTLLCASFLFNELPTYEEDDLQEVILFPIETVSDPENYDPNYLDSTTEALVYTLAALYLLDFLLLGVFLYNMFIEVTTRRTSIPIVAYVACILFVLCIFRICYMFIYAAGEFDDDPLADFAVFEIPTFLLFTTVILALGFWQKLVKQKSFFSTQEKGLVIMVSAAVFLVWVMYAVILIVYSEVVLQKKTTESPCPGRVAPSTADIDDATRTLFTVYQSIIIFFTFLLAVIFCKSSYDLIQVTKELNRAKKFVFRLGSIIVSSFMLRCILFIILLALDTTSDIFLFLILLFTEVFMIFAAQLLFNWKYIVNFGKSGSVLPSGINLSGTKGSSQLPSAGSMDSKLDD